MENEIDRSIIENTGVSIQKLDKSLNETVKVLGDIKKTLKESNKKSADAKPASSGGGGAKSSGGGTSLQESKNKIAEAAVKATGDLLTAIVGKAKSRKEKDAAATPTPPATTTTTTVTTTAAAAAATNVTAAANAVTAAANAATAITTAITTVTAITSAATEQSGEGEGKGKGKGEKGPLSYGEIADMAAVAGKGANDIIDQVKANNKAIAEEDVKIAEEKNAKERADLKKKFDQQLITKKEYDKAVAASDLELAKKKNEIAVEQAKKEKTLNITKVIIDSAVAIMAAWKSGPIVGGIMTAVITGLAAVQIAAIEKAPLPKARKGGVIVGGSHEQGGVLIEAEGGEAILSRAAMSAFPGVANLMNAAALSGGINDGGYAARSMASGSVEFGNRGGASSSQGIDYERLSSMMSEKMSQAKLFVAVTDINDGQRNYARISDMAKL